MTAQEFLKDKYRNGGCNRHTKFDYSEMVANMEEYASIKESKNKEVAEVISQRCKPVNQTGTFAGFLNQIKTRL